MFKRSMALVLGISLLLMGYWVYETFIPHDEDLEIFRQLCAKKEVATTHAFSPTKQIRKRVQKDIWFSQNDSARLHYHISSDSSKLTLTPVNNKFELVESLQGIRCVMQDKLISDGKLMQQARLIEADEGVYHYNTQQFTANGVLLSLFRLPGHTLPTKTLQKEEAFLRGISEHVSFVINGKTPQFQAENFQATMVKE